MTQLTDDKYKYYLYDLGLLIKERALEAKSERDRAQKGSEEYAYYAGRLMAFNEVISMMQQQASGFRIALEDLQLDDIVPDRDLL